MPTATAALRAAIHDALTADVALAGILGGARIYDEPPATAAFPYVTLGEARVSDFSAGDDALQEHQLTLHAWSRQGGHKEAHMIAGALLQALASRGTEPGKDADAFKRRLRLLRLPVRYLGHGHRPVRVSHPGASRTILQSAPETLAKSSAGSLQGRGDGEAFLFNA